MEARLDEKEKKLTSLDRKSKAVEYLEVPKEETVVKPVKGRKKWHRSKKQAAGRHEEPKELTRGICGSWRELAVACRKVSRRATVAWRKRNIFREVLT
jgi:hypothetical protein